MDELKYWLAFDGIKGIGLGSKRIYALFKHFKSLKLAWEAELTELIRAKDFPENIAKKFVEKRKTVGLDKGLELLIKHSVKAIPRCSPEYPEKLLKLKNPPLIIYVKGNWDASWFDKSIGIVGRRESSSYAENLTARISAELSNEGFAIISGVARGIDRVAHKACFALPESKLIAVVANGVDQAVPYEHRSMYEFLAQKGIILSEYPPETVPEKGFFPARNRIIAALSQAVLVAEAGERSGALITAENAVELGIPVFCLPGITDGGHNEQNAGCFKWIRQGRAKMVASTNDILEELGQELSVQPLQVKINLENLIKTEINSSKPSKQVSIEFSPEEKILFEHIEDSVKTGKEATIDKLVEKSKFTIAKVNSLLLKLSLKKAIERDGHIIRPVGH